MRSSGPDSLSTKSVLPNVFSPSRPTAQALRVVCIALFCFAIGVKPIRATPQQPPASAAGPDSVEGVTIQMEGVVPYEFNGDLRNLPQLSPSTATRQRSALPVHHAPPLNKTGVAPPILEGQQQSSANIVLPLTPAPSPTQNFAGLSFSDLCGTPPTTRCGGGIPPDPNGDVGPKNYIEAVNTAYAIYNKTGTLRASFTEDQLWSGSAPNTPCGNGNAAGDPIVVYDPLGDRWILAHIGSAFDSSNNPIKPFYECIAVSKTGDPVTGGWWFYALQMDPGGTGKPPSGTFNDYPKFGIWTDCLYMSANGFNGAAFTGAMYASMSRSDLESGATLTWSLGYLPNTNTNPSPFTMIPSNLRGTPPPSGTPNYFVSESQVQATAFTFDVRKFTAGPNCGGGGTLSGPTNVSHATYASPPGISVPQPGTNQLLDSLGDQLMQKVQYRRVGNTESLWVVHSVQVSSGLVQPQWAQLDVTGGTIASAPVQQEIYAPDTMLNRWMGSIAADKQGNVALGYSTSNGTAPNFPSIAYTGRLVTDSSGALGSEMQLVPGLGSQTMFNRWGDYSGMSVDPSDDCTFWYVNEYYSSQTNGANSDWQTRIGSFSFPSCTSLMVTLSPSSHAFNSQTAGTTSATINVQVTNAGSGPLTITSIALTGTDSSQFALVAPASGSPACSLAGVSTINAGNSCFLGVRFSPTSAGNKSANVSVSDNASGSPQAVGLSGVATQPAPAVALNPATVSFNDQSVGTMSATSNVQLTNTGTASLNVTSITLTGTDSSQFALVAPTSGSPACSLGGSTISAGSSCFVGVQFKPTATGQRSAGISVADNAPATPQNTALSGVGVDFSVAAAPPTTMTVAAGGNASFTINLTTTGGPTQNVTTFSASGNPANTSVAFGPPSIPSGASASSTTMTVITMRRSNGWPTAPRLPAPPQPLLLPYSILCLAIGSTFLFLKPNWRKRRISVCALGVVLLACAAFQGCARTGNTGGTQSGGTLVGTSTITVTATAGSVSRATTVVLTVQ